MEGGREERRGRGREEGGGKKRKGEERGKRGRSKKEVKGLLSSHLSNIIFPCFIFT
jgi:hypothetical protein